MACPSPTGKSQPRRPKRAPSLKRSASRSIIKSQVLVGGRGKAGGIKLAGTPDEAEEVAAKILGMDIKGLTVQKVLVDEAADIRSEIYLGAVLDRGARRVAIMASKRGGGRRNRRGRRPNARKRSSPFTFTHLLGMQGYQARQLAYGIGLPKEHVSAFTKIAQNLYRAFVDSDASLAEINPLVINGDSQLQAVDGKILLDDSALPRQKELAAMRDPRRRQSHRDRSPRGRNQLYRSRWRNRLHGERRRPRHGHHGHNQTVWRQPGQFSRHRRRGRRRDKVLAALRIILRDARVKAVLINIFGGHHSLR